MASDFTLFSWFVFYYSFILLIEQLTFIAYILIMQASPWIIYFVFKNPGSAILQEHDYLSYRLWRLGSSYIPSFNTYLVLLYGRGFTPVLLFSMEFNFCFQLVYQNVLILDECSALVNLPHYFRYKLNVAIIFKIYLFGCFYQFFNGVDDFIIFSLATIFYASHYIFYLASIIFLLWLWTVLFFLLRISLRRPMVLFAASLIILTSWWIVAPFFIYVINLGHCLTLHNFTCISEAMFWWSCVRARGAEMHPR